MFKQRLICVAVFVLLLASCDRRPVCELAPKPKSPSTLMELLKAHDYEVSEHGKDICYIQPMGAFGREGVLASLRHVIDRREHISSYNNIELVFGVAEEARTRSGYDICKDAATLRRISKMAKIEDSPAYQRKNYLKFLESYCRSKKMS